MTAITSFSGDYAFLSNFYPSPIKMLYPDPDSRFPADLAPIDYPTVEHFFQAEKVTSLVKKRWIADSPTPGTAKKRGRAVDLRTDWESVKYDVMAQGVEAKFHPAADLTKLLLATGDAYLVEGNTWETTPGARSTTSVTTGSVLFSWRVEPSFGTSAARGTRSPRC